MSLLVSMMLSLWCNHCCPLMKCVPSDLWYVGEVTGQHTATLTVLVATIDAQWEGMGDVGSARYEPALLPPSSTIRVLSYSN